MVAAGGTDADDGPGGADAEGGGGGGGAHADGVDAGRPAGGTDADDGAAAGAASCGRGLSSVPSTAWAEAAAASSSIFWSMSPFSRSRTSSIFVSSSFRRTASFSRCACWTSTKLSRTFFRSCKAASISAISSSSLVLNMSPNASRYTRVFSFCVSSRIPCIESGDCRLNHS